MSQSELVNKLIEKGKISDPKILKILKKVDRKYFYKGSGVYEDKPKRIGYNATISAPHMHGYALEYLKSHLNPGTKALDIGSGSGYFTVCMAEMMNYNGKVVGIEHVSTLAQSSINNIQEFNSRAMESIEIINSDGRLGCPEQAPFQAIHVGACIESVPDALIEQLDFGGRLMIPLGETESSQVITLVDKDFDGNLRYSQGIKVYFVPLCDLSRQLD